MSIRLCNLIILFAVIICACLLIRQRYQTRLDYILLNETNTACDNLNKEHTKLQLEVGTFSSDLILEDFAIHKLALIEPSNKQKMELK